MTDDSIPVVNEYRRVFHVRRRNDDSVEITLDSTPDEREALAKRFDLTELSIFHATLRIEAEKNGEFVHVAGAFTADLKQSCVVTLEPVPSHIDGKIFREYVDSKNFDETTPSIEFDPDAPDPPDKFDDGEIDLGEMLAEELGLEIEPFPRAAGLETGDYIEDDGSIEAGKSNNPFAILKELQDK